MRLSNNHYRYSQRRTNQSISRNGQNSLCTKNLRPPNVSHYRCQLSYCEQFAVIRRGFGTKNPICIGRFFHSLMIFLDGYLRLLSTARWMIHRYGTCLSLSICCVLLGG